jgi:hypothetical protein
MYRQCSNGLDTLYANFYKTNLVTKESLSEEMCIFTYVGILFSQTRNIHSGIDSGN